MSLLAAGGALMMSSCSVLQFHCVDAVDRFLYNCQSKERHTHLLGFVCFQHDTLLCVCDPSSPTALGFTSQFDTCRTNRAAGGRRCCFIMCMLVWRANISLCFHNLHVCVSHHAWRLTDGRRVDDRVQHATVCPTNP